MFSLFSKFGLLVLGLIFAYWALGCMWMIVKSFDSNNSESKDLSNKRGLFFIGALLLGGLTFILIPEGIDNAFNSNDDSLYYDNSSDDSDYGSNPSFGGAQTGYTGPCKITGCNCSAYDGSSDGICECRHYKTDHKWHN